MHLLRFLTHANPSAESAPSFIRAVEEIRGVRVLRLQGPVGKEIGRQEALADAEAARTEGVLHRPMLLDFKGTTDCDFSTVSYIVHAISQRMASGAQVGIINAPPQLLAEFQIARLDHLCKAFATEEEALASLTSTGGKTGKL